jgi:ABC-type cobalamin/Fe3+-siderophores transport system ATPase subunit
LEREKAMTYTDQVALSAEAMFFGGEPTRVLTCEHSASSYGVPVLVIHGDDGEHVFGPGDVIPHGLTWQGELTAKQYVAGHIVHQPELLDERYVQRFVAAHN